MNISREEAAESLAAIEQAAERTRNTAGQVAGPMLIVWGVVWVIGFSTTHFAPAAAGPTWAVLDTAGGLLSWRIGSKMSAVKSGHDWRIAVFFLALFLYGAIWAFLLAPFNPTHIGGYIASLVMFAYVIGGLWWDRFFLYLGLGVTVLILVGATFLKPIENLWLGFAGGGALTASGIYLLRKARHAQSQ